MNDERCNVMAGCQLKAGHSGFHEIRDESAELRARVQKLEQENVQLAGWNRNILNTVKAFPEYEPGEWAGDKEGWGYCFELINYVRRQRDKLLVQLAAMTTARDEACGELEDTGGEFAIARAAELRKVGIP